MDSGSRNHGEEEFAGHVDVFFKIDDELRGASEEIKGLKSSRSSLEGRIARHMHENGIPETFSPSGKIKIYRSKSSAPLNKTLIEESATELFGADQAARLMKHVGGKRAVTEKIKIKRVSVPPNKAKATAQTTNSKSFTSLY